MGGLFKSAGEQPANYIAKWNGTSWDPVGGGVNSPVHSLGVYNDELYAGGLFDTVDAAPVNHIARWNGKISK